MQGRRCQELHNENISIGLYKRWVDTIKKFFWMILLLASNRGSYESFIVSTTIPKCPVLTNTNIGILSPCYYITAKNVRKVTKLKDWKTWCDSLFLKNFQCMTHYKTMCKWTQLYWSKRSLSLIFNCFEALMKKL